MLCRGNWVSNLLLLNYFARSLRALRRTGENEFDKRSKRSITTVPTGPFSVQWTPAGWAENGN